jgi:hypothetical protein
MENYDILSDDFSSKKKIIIIIFPSKYIFLLTIIKNKNSPFRAFLA